MCHTAAMAAADKDILYRVAYEEAVRALVEQQGEIDSFRSRAGLMFTFTAAAAISLAILWPRPWELSASSPDVVETYIEGEHQAAVADLHRDLSIHMQESYAQNRSGVLHLAVLLQVASGLLTLEVVFWIIGVATSA
jgi:hypothetical protein